MDPGPGATLGRVDEALELTYLRVGSALRQGRPQLPRRPLPRRDPPLAHQPRYLSIDVDCFTLARPL